MSGSAHVNSTDALRRFAAAVALFQEEARSCLQVLDGQLRQMVLWLEQDRPIFWKREIEHCMREMNEARVRLHQCHMRRTGDFRPSCIEEVKALEAARRAMESAQQQIPNIRRWHIEVAHEGNEFRGRASQLAQTVERDIPHLLALLAAAAERLESYAAIPAPPPLEVRDSDPQSPP